MEEISRILSEAIDQTHEKAPELFVEDAGVAQPEKSILFFCKKLSVWSILLQNGTSAFPGSLYIDFIGHVILDQREASLGTAALFTNC